MFLRRWTALAAIAALGLAACSGGDEGSEDGTLTVWTVEDVAERVEAQKALLARYTEATGTPTELVPVAEDQLVTVLTSAAASGDLPDVIGAASLTAVNQLRTDELLDTGAAAEVVGSLRTDTFSPAALELTRDGDDQLAVPSDGWAQLLYYRKDLLQQAGLGAPETFEAIAAAAAALDAGGTAGIVAATAPADSFTHQTFEQFALAEGCRLTDDGGAVALGSDRCAATIRFYADLIREHSVAGNQDADTTRAAYFAGTAGMVVWSSFLLDELAGLRADALPTCPQCAADPGWLARNTGVVGALRGPDATEPATYGEIVSWAILTESDPGTTGLVEWLMGDGYEDWLRIAPEGKVPVRRGTPEEPERFLTAWQGMEAGVDTRAPLSEFYGPDVLEAVATSPDRFTRWGLREGQGALAGGVAGQFVLPKELAEVINSGKDPAEAARDAASEAERIQDEVAP